MFDLHRSLYEFDEMIMTRPDMSAVPKGQLKFNEPMSRHTSWRVGGPADRFYRPLDLQDLKNFLSQLPVDEPLTWIGLGSNLLVRDGGIRGTVIVTKNVINELEIQPSGQIKAGAGIVCARLARQAVKSGFTGAEFFIGIPGTLGGAMAMNAGAFGSETWDIVQQVITVNRQGYEQIRTRSELVIEYRSVSKPIDEWFVSGLLELHPDTRQTAHNTIREFLARRKKTQPIGEASCGSVFRNPDTDIYAARLVEECGLKGYSIGDASVSIKHSNFIINHGSATASDIEKLIQHIQQQVYEKHSVTLVPEVRIIGERLTK